jgi:hypothetical protein
MTVRQEDSTDGWSIRETHHKPSALLTFAADSGVVNPWRMDSPDYQFPAPSFSGPDGTGSGNIGWYLGGWSAPTHGPPYPAVRSRAATETARAC